MTRLPAVPVLAVVAALILGVVVVVSFAAWRMNRPDQLPAGYPTSPRVLPILCTANACIPAEVVPYVVERQS